jgi:hypothetical protein
VKVGGGVSVIEVVGRELPLTAEVGTWLAGASVALVQAVRVNITRTNVIRIASLSRTALEQSDESRCMGGLGWDRGARDFNKNSDTSEANKPGNTLTGKGHGSTSDSAYALRSKRFVAELTLEDSRSIVHHTATRPDEL